MLWFAVASVLLVFCTRAQATPMSKLTVLVWDLGIAWIRGDGEFRNDWIQKISLVSWSWSSLPHPGVVMPW